ncbi:hypothetical protein F2Q70_00018282 [Brassica cretica]|uniref:Uncharacterized protein n=1 Tax=Brassica cretica TaxID=69181 RepID=A0A8S9HY93_BRACR|nr:hypothetical protein F2Q70_00018282 [Brassica cretica]
MNGKTLSLTWSKKNPIGQKALHQDLSRNKRTVVVHEVDGLEGQEELCFVNANGTWYKKEPNFQYNNYQQKPFYNNQQGGYQARQNYSQGFSSKGNQSTQGQAGSSTSAPQESSTDAMLKQILEFQTRSEKHIRYELKNLHTKVDGSYNDLNNKLLQLSSHFNALENQFASMPSTSKRPMGSLPGKSEQNPKDYCNVIISTTASEIELTQIVDKTEHKAMEKVKTQAELKVAAENLKRHEHKAENEVEREAVQRLKEVKLKGTTEVEQSPYDKLPFPQRVLTKAQKKVISKFRNDMSAVGVKLPEISHMRDAHVQMMLIRDILAHKEEVAELLDISTMQLDPPVTPKSLPKLETQGKFTLSCSLGKFTLDDALVDSGASVNVISMEMVKTLVVALVVALGPALSQGREGALSTHCFLRGGLTERATLVFLTLTPFNGLLATTRFLGAVVLDTFRLPVVLVLKLRTRGGEVSLADIEALGSLTPPKRNATGMRELWPPSVALAWKGLICSYPADPSYIISTSWSLAESKLAGPRVGGALPWLDLPIRARTDLLSLELARETPPEPPASGGKSSRSRRLHGEGIFCSLLEASDERMNHGSEVLGVSRRQRPEWFLKMLNDQSNECSAAWRELRGFTGHVSSSWKSEKQRNENWSVVLKRPDAPALDDWSVERPTGTRYDTRSVPERLLAARTPDISLPGMCYEMSEPTHQALSLPYQRDLMLGELGKLNDLSLMIA